MLQEIILKKMVLKVWRIKPRVMDWEEELGRKVTENGREKKD